MSVQYLLYSITLSFVSWTVGALVAERFHTRSWVQQWLKRLNLLPSEKVNRLLGVGTFRWVVVHTFFSVFNPKLNLKAGKTRDDLVRLREEMTKAELGHWIGFLFMLLVSLVLVCLHHTAFAGIVCLVNGILNLYPALLQQYNKRRLDPILERYSRRQNGQNTVP
jgi:hypothetical protein